LIEANDDVIAQKNLLLDDGLPRKQAEIPKKHLKTY
jgi:hypothetical protein